MTLEELNAIVDGVSKPFREQLNAANQRIAQLEQRASELPAPARIDIEAIAERAAELIPAPKDGRDGRDGKDGESGNDGKDAAEVDAAAIVADVLRQIPTPKDGKDGSDGQDAPAVDTESIVARVLSQIPIPKDGRDAVIDHPSLVQDVLAKIPAPKDGKDADPVDTALVISEVLRQMPEPKQGKDGENGKDGKDAELPDLEPIVQRVFDANWAKYAVDIDRRAHDLFHLAIEKMPTPKDAFELEDLTVDHDGHGNVTLTFIRGELKRSFTLRFPTFEYRGVFRENDQYLAGNAVSFGGSVWIARKDDPQGKPEERSADWTLAVKRGRNGSDGVMKPPKPEGPVKL